MIVVDASLMIAMASGEETARDVVDRLEAQGAPLTAPELIDLEVRQTFRRLVHQKRMSVERAEGALASIEALNLTRFSHAPLTARIWALRDNMTAYDAVYVALAEWLGAPLWTRDAKFAAIPGADVQVEIV